MILKTSECGMMFWLHQAVALSLFGVYHRIPIGGSQDAPEIPQPAPFPLPFQEAGARHSCSQLNLWNSTPMPRTINPMVGFGVQLWFHGFTNRWQGALKIECLALWNYPDNHIQSQSHRQKKVTWGASIICFFQFVDMLGILAGFNQWHDDPQGPHLPLPP